MNLATIIGTHPAGDPALRFHDEVVTYGELRAEVGALRGGLIAGGLVPGERVVLVLASRRKFIVSYLAVLGAGGVAVPLNPQSPANELAKEIEAVRPSVIIVGDSGTAELVSTDKLTGVRVIAPLSAGLFGAESYEDACNGTAGPIVERVDNDLAVLIFTSGTAGAPKAAMLTHGNLRANIEQLQSQPELRILATDVVLGIPPLFHIYGLNATLGLSLASGACLVPVDKFDVAEAVQDIANHKVTILAGVPPIYDAIAALPESQASRQQLGSLRRAVSGASKLDIHTAHEFHDRFGVVIAEGYGLTEAAPVVTAGLDDPSGFGTIGIALPGVSVRLVEEDGSDALVGDGGEIWVKGPNVFPGYWEDPEATARVLTTDGWLRTGDIAVVSSSGALSIVDRAKDLIIVSGFNVYPAEVEEALLSHPDVAEAAVIGSPSKQTGETVKAFVVPSPGAALSADALVAHCRKQLSRYKCPTAVEVLSELPKGLQGKVLRRALS